MGIKLSPSQINLLTQIAPKKISDRSSIPDGYIYTDDYKFCVGIETKIEPNALIRNQLIGHLNQLNQNDKGYLLILTPDEKEPNLVKSLKIDNKSVRFISWIDLLNLMSKIGADEKADTVGRYLFEEFMGFMERKYHMTPFTGINFNDGYDYDLARHYIKRLSDILTPKIINIYPECTNTRPAIRGAWQAWYSTKEVQKCVHPSLGIRADHVRCNIYTP